jgi:hypothetical protein
MRKLPLYILLLLLGIKSSSGQDYFKLLRPNVSWDVTFWSHDQFCTTNAISKYFIKGEITIGDKVYKKIVYQSYYINKNTCYPGDFYLDTTTYNYTYLREDTLLKRVYMYECDKELLLYDFSLQVNDSIKMYTNIWDDCPWTDSVSISVDDVSQYTLLDGRIVKRLDNTSYYWSLNPSTILEGIGNLYDPFNFIQNSWYDFEGGSYLDCVTDNGIVIYGAPVLWDAVDTKLTNRAELYPNPANDKIYLKLDRYIRTDIILLVNLLGEKFKANWTKIGDDLIETDITGLPSGIYFIIIPGEKNNYFKFIKCK